MLPQNSSVQLIVQFSSVYVCTKTSSGKRRLFFFFNIDSFCSSSKNGRQLGLQRPNQLCRDKTANRFCSSAKFQTAKANDVKASGLLFCSNKYLALQKWDAVLLNAKLMLSLQHTQAQSFIFAELSKSKFAPAIAKCCFFFVFFLGGGVV